MAVLIEAHSVVFLAERLLKLFSWEEFERMVPNATLCADGELVRIGFMHPDDTRDFVEGLKKRGLRYFVDGKAEDIVVVDQVRGVAVPCDWIELGRIEIAPGATVLAARLAGSENDTLMKPEHWRFEKSLSQTVGYLPDATAMKSSGLEFIDERDGVQVFRSKLTGEHVFIGRARDREGEVGDESS